MRENEKMKGGPSFKRYERDGRFDGFKTTKELAKPSRHHRNTSARLPPIKPLLEPKLSNIQLLADYLANEFLSKGTLLGQKWDPDRAEDSIRLNPTRKSEPREPSEEKKAKDCERYMEVADLLKMDGIHLPRIVNPKQLSVFLQLGKDVLFT